jgi:hypothetical protein
MPEEEGYVLQVNNAVHNFWEALMKVEMWVRGLWGGQISDWSSSTSIQSRFYVPIWVPEGIGRSEGWERRLYFTPLLSSEKVTGNIIKVSSGGRVLKRAAQRVGANALHTLLILFASYASVFAGAI